MPVTAPVSQIEPTRMKDPNARLTVVFTLSLVGSGLVCCALGSYIVPIIEAAGLDGLVVYVLMFLGGLLGLFVSLAPLMKPALIQAHAEPIDS